MICEEDMNVPFLDLKAQYETIKTEINDAIQAVLNSGSFILGKPVGDFEYKFAELHKAKHCIGLSSGTDGNHAVLWALGIGKGDEVIIPANTFIATAWGAVLNGATPVFADCEEESCNISPEEVERVITPKTKAVVVVHLYGQPADIDKIKEITDRYNIFLVEDCAQAHNAEYKGKKVGGLSEASSFSFYPGKNLGAYGEAGCAMTSNDRVAEKIRMIRDHGSNEKYNHHIFGHNYRMESIQGAILNLKLKYLEKWTERRREIAGQYNRLLENISEIKTPVEMRYARHVYHLYVIRLLEHGARQRNRLTEYLKEKGISTGLHYPVPLHLQTCFNYLGYKKGEFPVTEKIADSCISLPVYPELTAEQVEYVCHAIGEYFGYSQREISRSISVPG